MNAQGSSLCFMAYVCVGLFIFFWTRTYMPRFWFPAFLEYSRTGLAIVIVGIVLLWPILVVHLMIRYFLFRRN